MMVKNFAIFSIALLGFCFPSHLINAIREQDVEKAKNAKCYASLCFGTMMLFLGMLINS